MCYLAGFLRTSSTVSQIALRDGSEEVTEEPGYIGVLATKTRYLEHQKITIN